MTGVRGAAALAQWLTIKVTRFGLATRQPSPTCGHRNRRNEQTSLRARKTDVIASPENRRQPNRRACGGARGVGMSTPESRGDCSCRWFSIFLVTAESSMQAHLGRSTAGPAGRNLNIEHPFQSLCPSYCHGWHVCRFCRSKNRLLPHSFAPVFSHPDPQQFSGWPCRAWLGSLTPGVCCSA